MCVLSWLGSIIYGAVMIVTTGLTIGSMFSPGWHNIVNETTLSVTTVKRLIELPKQYGILPFLCRSPELNHSGNAHMENLLSTDMANDFCKLWWDTLPRWEKAVVVFMCLALATELFTLLWTFLSCAGCCCKTACIRFLPILAFAISVFLAVAVGIFAAYNSESLDFLTNERDIHQVIEKQLKTEVGFSFYLAVAALVGAVLDILVGVISVATANCFC